MWSCPPSGTSMPATSRSRWGNVSERVIRYGRSDAVKFNLRQASVEVVTGTQLKDLALNGRNALTS